jgi:prevent-host-death family protein
MIYTIADAKRRFSELVKRAAYRGESFTVGTRGRPQVALVSVEELHRLRALDQEQDARFLEQAVRASRGTVSIEALLKAWGEAHPKGERNSASGASGKGSPRASKERARPRSRR